MTTKTVTKICLLTALGLASVVFNACKDDEPKPTPSEPVKITHTIEFVNIASQDQCNTGKIGANGLADSVKTFGANYEIIGKAACTNWQGPPAHVNGFIVDDLEKAVAAGLKIEPFSAQVSGFNFADSVRAAAMGITFFVKTN